MKLDIFTITIYFFYRYNRLYHIDISEYLRRHIKHSHCDTKNYVLIK